jgi:pyruvate dehydrogenase E2 component (dihydrolipoamide acetyltransferase)
MPRLGLTMTEGTVTEWRVEPGQPVGVGSVVVVIESEKTDFEVEAFAAGTLGAVYVEPGTTVPIGALLGAIVAPGEAFDADAFAASFVPELDGAPATADTAHAEAPARATPPADRAPGAIKAAPAARALAKKLGVDLARVAASGPGGRITVEDVERAAAGTAASSGTAPSFATAGSGPPLLLVCGFGVDQTGWKRQVDGLADAFTVATYDHRGVGAAAPLAAGSSSIADLAADADALLTELGNGPATVVGASMGAAVALELAIRRPAAVRALVLITPAVERDPRLEAVLTSWAEADDPTSPSRIRGMLPWLLGRDFLSHRGKREAAAQALAAMAARTPPETLRRHSEALVSWLGSRDEALRSIAVPALVVAGEDDVLTPLTQAQALARRLRRARLEVVLGAGHALMIERAEALNDLVRSFASRA